MAVYPSVSLCAGLETDVFGQSLAAVELGAGYGVTDILRQTGLLGHWTWEKHDEPVILGVTFLPAEAIEAKIGMHLLRFDMCCSDQLVCCTQPF